MPRYFAEINNQGVVIRVIVADSLDWCEENHGGQWIETYLDLPDHNYAGVGHTYHAEKNNFVEPKPYESWELNNKAKWESPVKREQNDIEWDEKNLRWKKEEEVINRFKK